MDTRSLRNRNDWDRLTGLSSGGVATGRIKSDDGLLAAVESRSRSLDAAVDAAPDAATVKSRRAATANRAPPHPAPARPVRDNDLAPTLRANWALARKRASRTIGRFRRATRHRCVHRCRTWWRACAASGRGFRHLHRQLQLCVLASATVSTPAPAPDLRLSYGKHRLGIPVTR